MKLSLRYPLLFGGDHQTKSGGWGGRRDDPARARPPGLPTLPLQSRENRRCGACVHFRNEPEYLEAAFPGLASLSSAYGSVRGDDGLCVLRDRYLGAHCSCPDFTGRPAI